MNGSDFLPLLILIFLLILSFFFPSYSVSFFSPYFSLHTSNAVTITFKHLFQQKKLLSERIFYVCMYFYVSGLYMIILCRQEIDKKEKKKKIKYKNKKKKGRGIIIIITSSISAYISTSTDTYMIYYVYTICPIRLLIHVQ